MLTLYHHPRSTYARRVVIALAEKNIAYTPVILDMAARENRAPAYLALNPDGRVPTLIVQASDDALAPLDVGEYMHRNMPGSSLQVVRNIGHCPMLCNCA